MGILTSMMTAVSGLNAYGNALSVIGNNVANAGTVGYKSSRSLFAEMISASMGSSKRQVGLGVYLGEVEGNFGQGAFTNTGNAFDMAIDGNGFFQVRNGSGARFFTRAGAFKVDSQGRIVDPTGHILQGYQADPVTGEIVEESGDITLTNTTMAPNATTEASLQGSLDASASVPAGAFSATDPSTYNFSTGMTIYDSLGSAHTLRFYMVKTATANNWDLYRQVDGGAATAATDLTFNASGALTGGGSQTLSLTIAGGATTPQSVTVDFSDMTQYGSTSSINDQTQDGYAAGALQGLSVDTEGQIVAQFTNGLTRVLAQVELSRFSNPHGLVRAGDNLFTSSTESGQAVIGTADSNGLGRLVSGTLEQSNVDLGKEFVDMIVTQRAFQANSRAITTSDEMLQELVNLKR